ncbi:MAG: DnaJ domain-containing protein [bacterium]|nr:DnaJ domain-containing protein [bacterium]
MDPYRVLDVARDADQETIKKRYRKLARETHPDLNPGDEAAETRFKEISVAYDVLSDPDRRAAFDEFGEISLEGGFDAERARAERDAFSQRFGAADGAGFEGAFSFADLDDLLRGFGMQGGGPGAGRGGGAPRFRMRGHDVEATLELDFLDALLGGEQKITVGRPQVDGAVTTETVSVRVPPGVTDQGTLRIPGKGGIGAGGAPDGDLLLRPRVRPHPVFRQKGRDVELDLPLRLSEALLGATVDVPTPEGPVQLRVPAGTSSGRRLRLRGRGVPAHGNHPAGDLYARVEIVVPDEIPDALREQLEALEQPDPRKGVGA